MERKKDEKSKYVSASFTFGTQQLFHICLFDKYFYIHVSKHSKYLKCSTEHSRQNPQFHDVCLRCRETENTQIHKQENIISC